MALDLEGRKSYVQFVPHFDFYLAPVFALVVSRNPATKTNLQNKTSSAVQLKHAASGIVLKVQATRSRTQNRKLARQMLADRLEDIEKGDQSRSAIKTAVKQKRKSSATKKTRRKYRKLEEEKVAGEEGTGKEE